MIGQVLGDRYRVEQVLGKKAGRSTLLACDRVTGELVTIKLVLFSSNFEWDDLKLFEREAQILKAVSHPAIPRYLDCFEIESPQIAGKALVQSYIPAQNLEQHLLAGRIFTEAEVKDIAATVLSILNYLHGLLPPIIHRDIKPSNILLGDTISQVYLIDFGSVQRAGETQTVVGTYGYMSPEQFGFRSVPASDLYSLGATLIYLVTGTHPGDLPQNNLLIEFSRSTSVSPAFRDWLGWMTEPSLERRLGSASSALSTLKEGKPIVPAINKPPESKIQLHRDTDFLEISIAPIGFQAKMGQLALFAIAWNWFILFWTITVLTSAPFPVNIPISLFSLPFWGVGVAIAYRMLFALFVSVKLRVDRFSISKTNVLFGWKLLRNYSSPRENITKLVYSKGDRYSAAAQLQVWAGVEKYELSENNSGIKSEAELVWLAQELSNWLGIPITRE